MSPPPLPPAGRRTVLDVYLEQFIILCSESMNQSEVKFVTSECQAQNKITLIHDYFRRFARDRSRTT